MKHVLLVVVLNSLFLVSVFGQDALSIDSQSNVRIEKNLRVEGSLQVLGEPSLPPEFFFGMETRMATNDDGDLVDNAITIQPGICRSYIGTHEVDYQDEPINTTYGDSTNIFLSEEKTASLNTVWSQDEPGRFSGVDGPLPNETYYLFVIEKDELDANSNPIVSVGFDINRDCKNIPEGYSAFRGLRTYITDENGLIRGGYPYDSKTSSGFTELWTGEANTGTIELSKDLSNFNSIIIVTKTTGLLNASSTIPVPILMEYDDREFSGGHYHEGGNSYYAYVRYRYSNSLFCGYRTHGGYKVLGVYGTQ